MEESSSKDKPHLVLRGKNKGVFLCEKSCPKGNVLKVCSHVVATAEDNSELSDFLLKFKPQSNVSKLVLLTCQTTLGKGGKQLEKKTPQVEITSRKPRLYSQVRNTNPFFMKLLTNPIEVCQGCRGSLKSPQETIPAPPFNYCVKIDRTKTSTEIAKCQIRSVIHTIMLMQPVFLRVLIKTICSFLEIFQK